MNVEFITKADLQVVKDEILSAMAQMVGNHPTKKNWMKSSDVRNMLHI